MERAFQTWVLKLQLVQGALEKLKELTKAKAKEGAERMGRGSWTGTQYQIAEGFRSNFKESGKGVGKKNLRRPCGLVANWKQSAGGKWRWWWKDQILRFRNIILDTMWRTGGREAVGALWDHSDRQDGSGRMKGRENKQDSVVDQMWETGEARS